MPSGCPTRAGPWSIAHAERSLFVGVDSSPLQTLLLYSGLMTGFRPGSGQAVGNVREP
jgi:hypothetical protein